MAHTDLKDSTFKLSETEGYQEMLRSFLGALPAEQRLAGLAPEQRLAGLAPEQRLAGLAPAERRAGLAPDESVLVLADEVLVRLPAEFIATLPEAVQAQIQERLRALRDRD